MAYRTSEIAKEAGVHPNTVRYYEEIGFLPPIPRNASGYRVFADTHLTQLKLIKAALRSEILQSNLRKQACEIIMLCAEKNHAKALERTIKYHTAICKEIENAEEAINLVRDFLYYQDDKEHALQLKRNEAAKHLGITIDTLRNWELNGLITIPRKENGYRAYTNKEIRELKIIRTLRNANYSLMSILRMLNRLKSSADSDLRLLLDTPNPDEDIVSVTDKLLTSLSDAKCDAEEMIVCISKMK